MVLERRKQKEKKRKQDQGKKQDFYSQGSTQFGEPSRLTHSILGHRDPARLSSFWQVPRIQVSSPQVHVPNFWSTSKQGFYLPDRKWFASACVISEKYNSVYVFIEFTGKQQNCVKNDHVMIRTQLIKIDFKYGLFQIILMQADRASACGKRFATSSLTVLNTKTEL